MEVKACSHKDVREFGDALYCFSCGQSRTYLPAVASLFTYVETVPTPTTYEYDNLDRNKDEIRLIVLRAGRSSHPIHCHIVSTALQSAPGYTALSYTWATESGDINTSQTIQIESSSVWQGPTILKVTKNCEAALVQLRQVDRDRTVWVDSNSINQMQIQERNHQVGLMGKIYEMAETVEICNCDAAHEYKGAMSLLSPSFSSAVLEEMYRKRHEEFETLSNLHPGLETIEVNEDPTGIPIGKFGNHPHIIQLADLFQLRYFSRVWVIQEVLSAKFVVLRINNASVLLTKATLAHLHEWCAEHFVTISRLAKWTSAWNRKTDIISCLNISLDSSSADPRDKVFAIIGLVEPQDRRFITIDYLSSVEQVYSDAVMACIAPCRDLDILSYAGIELNADNTSPCSFSTENFKQFLAERNHAQGHGKSSSHLRHPWVSHVSITNVREDGTLSRSAKASHSDYNYIAQYTSTTPVLKVKDPIPAAQILPRLRVRAHLIDICTTLAGGSTAQLMSTMDSGIRNIHTSKWSWLLNIFTEPFTNGCVYDELHMDMFKLDVARATSGDETIFRTYYSVGFTASHCLPDDGVFAIDSAHHPFLLRSVDHGVYRIVGKCYVWAAIDLDY
jgi:hypothetical protein